MMAPVRFNLRLPNQDLIEYLKRKTEEYNQKHQQNISINKYIEKCLMRLMIDDQGVDRPDLFELQKQVKLLSEKVEALVDIQHQQYQAIQSFLEEL